jgi:hypothetical protein
MLRWPAGGVSTLSRAAVSLARTCDEGVHSAPEAGAHGRHRSSSAFRGRRLGAVACVALLLGPHFLQQRKVQALDEVGVLQVAAQVARLLDRQRGCDGRAEREAARGAQRPSQPCKRDYGERAKQMTA